MARWPDNPLIPEAWDSYDYHPEVLTSLSEGFCPKHLVRLDSAGYCRSCGVGWELTSCVGTVPTSYVPIPGRRYYPPFAVTDGYTVLVERELHPDEG